VKRLLSIFLASALIASLAAPAYAQQVQAVKTPAVQPPKKQINTAEIDRRATLLMNQLEMTGLSVAVVENGKTTFAKGYGEETRDSGRMVTADTVFRWASVSKGVAANTLLSLIEDTGNFSLADSAEQLAPSLDLPEVEGQPANLIHLLSQSQHELRLKI